MSVQFNYVVVMFNPTKCKTKRGLSLLDPPSPYPPCIVYVSDWRDVGKGTGDDYIHPWDILFANLS